MASFALLIGFYITGVLVKETLAKDRLEQEAADYWRGAEQIPGFPLPRTSTVRGFFIPVGTSARTLPMELQGLAPGVHDLRVPDRSHKVLVQERPGGTLYVRMSFRLLQKAVWWTGVCSMLLALLAIYSVSWLSYRSAIALVRPVNRLAEAVSRWDPRQPDVHAIRVDSDGGDAGTEVHQLGGALRDLAARTQDFVQRERDFTRDASHELRTPLTVVRVATDMMRADPETPARMQRSLHRIQRAGQDMEAVIDAFLILAREGDVAPRVEDFAVHDLVYEAVDKALPMLAGKPVALEVVESSQPTLHAAPSVLRVMLDNLLSNACTFTEEGRIEVHIERDRIVVNDTGIGMAPETLQRVYDPFYRADQFNPSGKGMGLSIVRRLGERFGWPVMLESTPGAGTRATISFADTVAG